MVNSGTIFFLLTLTKTLKEPCITFSSFLAQRIIFNRHYLKKTSWYNNRKRHIAISINFKYFMVSRKCLIRKDTEVENQIIISTNIIFV